MQKWWNQASDTIHQFSKVTRYLMDTIGQQGGLEDHRPVAPEIKDNCRIRTSSGEFELLSDREVSVSKEFCTIFVKSLREN